MGKQVITVNDIISAAENGNKILNVRPEDCIITPGAWDKIGEMGIRFAGDPPASLACEGQSGTASGEIIPGTQGHECSDTVAGEGRSRAESITDQVCSLLRARLPQKSIPGLETLVKTVVESRLSNRSALGNLEKNAAVTILGGVSLINGNKLLDECSGPNIPGKVLISDAIRCHEASHLSATYMKWEKTSFSRTVESPEISIILEGDLDLIVDGRTLSAKAGDILYMAKGAEVTYSSPSMVKLACVN